MIDPTKAIEDPDLVKRLWNQAHGNEFVTVGGFPVSPRPPAERGDALPCGSRVSQARARFLPLTDEEIMQTMATHPRREEATSRLLDDLQRPSMAARIGEAATAAAEEEAEEPERWDGQS